QTAATALCASNLAIACGQCFSLGLAPSLESLSEVVCWLGLEPQYSLCLFCCLLSVIPSLFPPSPLAIVRHFVLLLALAIAAASVCVFLVCSVLCRAYTFVCLSLVRHFWNLFLLARQIHQRHR